MNKAELLQKLNDKFYRVEDPGPARQTYGNLKYYLVKVYDLLGDALRDINIAFYVESEGEVDEVAYWSPSEPKPEPTTGFTQEVNDYIKSVIDAEQIEGAFIEAVDEVKEIAVARIIMNDLTEQSRFVDRDANGDLQHRQIT